MDTSALPLVFLALLAGLAGTWIEMQGALRPPVCPECAHCRDRVARERQERLDEERQQADARAAYARRWRQDRDDTRHE
jgi:hypothetical protein